MKFKGTLLKPLAEQHDSDQRYIDPSGVKFDPDTEYPIFNNFSYDAKDVLGAGKVSRAEDGSLVVEGDLRMGQHPWQLAIGIRTEESIRTRDTFTIHKSDIMSIALTDNHADVTQPNIKVRND